MVHQGLGKAINGSFSFLCLAWRIKEETFLKKIDPVSDLKSGTVMVLQGTQG